MDTEPAAPSKASTRLPIPYRYPIPIAAALGLFPPGLTMSAALVGRGAVSSLGIVEQQPASLHVGNEGVTSIQTITIAPCDGREMLAGQI